MCELHVPGKQAHLMLHVFCDAGCAGHEEAAER